MMYGLLYSGYEGWGIGNPIGWAGSGVMMIVMMVAIAVFIVGVVRMLDDKHPQHDSSQALAILKERYARGDITKERFEEMKKDIR